MTSASSRHSGWHADEGNSRLDLYYKGTRLGHINANGLNMAASTLTLPTSLRTGFIPLPLTAWRLIASNDIAAKNATDGGTISVDTDPKLIRVNAATDKQINLTWAATSVIPVTIQFATPPDLDTSASVTFKMLAKMAGASDTPVVAVTWLENGTGAYSAAVSIGGNTAAVTGTSVAVYSRAVTKTKSISADTIELIPAAHGTDVLAVFATWIEYTRLTS